MTQFYHRSRLNRNAGSHFVLTTAGGVLVLILAFSACDMRDRKVSSEALKEEISQREIKRVNEAQIFEKASQIGEQIATTSQKTLGSSLKMAISEQGLEHAIEYCNLQAMPLSDSLSEKFGAQIRRTSLKVRNPSNRPNDLETKILEAYAYNAENGLELIPNLQRIDQDYLLYTRPILLENALCLNCHGTPGEEINDPQMELLRLFYPDDKAVGYELGQLRGMWSIRLSQKEVVLAL